jgi:hypothetical protein
LTTADNSIISRFSTLREKDTKTAMRTSDVMADTGTLCKRPRNDRIQMPT